MYVGAYVCCREKKRRKEKNNNKDGGECVLLLMMFFLSKEDWVISFPGLSREALLSFFGGRHLGREEKKYPSVLMYSY